MWILNIISEHKYINLVTTRLFTELSKVLLDMVKVPSNII